MLAPAVQSAVLLLLSLLGAVGASECSDGDVGFNRPGFDLGNSSMHTPDAEACAKACSGVRTCRQWAWKISTRRCWLKNLVGPRYAEADFCSATRKGNPGAAEVFPLGNFTPYTYLQNPYHRVFHKSGNIRSDDTVNGLGYDWDYKAILAVSARPQGMDGPVLLMNDAFDAAGVGRHSDLHTKSRFRAKWSVPSAEVSAEYWQVAEDLIACEVRHTASAEGGASSGANAFATASFDIILQAVGHDQKQQAKGVFNASAGSHGGVCANVHGQRAAIAVTLVAAPRAPDGHSFFPDNVSAAAELATNWDDKASNYTNPNGNKLLASFTFKNLPVDGQNVLLLMSRANTCAEAFELVHASDLASISEVYNQRYVQREEDAAFWKGAPVPTGHFSDAWKHGVVYDLNTVRLNLRPAVGIFRTEWDAMQIENPRVVVAESSMDFLAMSYADPAKAKEVYLGMFASAIGPNVPCVWENGRPNMVCDDGSVSGTPPAWGNPLKNILSVYQRDSDKEWLAKLYPLLGDYLNFWLTHRKMKGTEYQTCRCSWECGQDDEPRWSFNQSSGGSVTDRFRVVEMQAATAHAAGVLAYFGRELKRPPHEIQRWEGIIKTYTKLTLALWAPSAASPFGGWFADFDTQTGKVSPYGAWNMQLAPLFFHDPDLGVDLFPPSSGINASKLAESIKSTFWSAPPGLTPNISFCQHTEPQWGHDLCWTVSGQSHSPPDAFRLDRIWAPSPWTMGEGAAVVGRRDIASEFTERTLDTVYPVMDMRTKQPNLPLPGCAYECWDTALMDPSMPPVSNYRMAEAYGWSSIATVLFIRTVVGFRELPASLRADAPTGSHMAFELAPNLPEKLLQRDFCPQEYGVSRINFQGSAYKLSYTHSCAAHEAAKADGRVQLTVRLTHVPEEDGEVEEMDGKAPTELEFEATNGGRYRVAAGEKKLDVTSLE